MGRLTHRLLRPDDLLHLVIQTENLRLETGSSLTTSEENSAGESAFLVVDDPEKPALFRVLFPPQHIAEFAAFESDPLSAPDQKLAADPSGSSPEATAANQQRTQAQSDVNDKPTGQLDPDPLPRPGSGAFQGRVSGSSRLVFRVPPGRRIPYTVEGLLDWQALEPLLHPIAAIAENASATERSAAPAISAPGADQTALELPYRLLISPSRQATWQHRCHPFGQHGRFELWHTRLVKATTSGFREFDANNTAPLRALWSSDYRPDGRSGSLEKNATTGLGRTALSEDDRHQIVVLTSAFRGYESDRLLPVFRSGAAGSRAGFIRMGTETYVPKPFHASQLMLSPLGGWLRSRGSWTPPRTSRAARRARPIELTATPRMADLLASLDPGSSRLRSLMELPDFGSSIAAARPAESQQLDLSEWVHRATMGRDHYVRVVYEGELWPFRHKAALVKITERKFIQSPKDGDLVIACLVQRVFVVVRQPEVTLNNRADVPLKRVRLTTLVTPNLAEPRIPAVFKRSFWVEVGSAPSRSAFRFHAVGIDQADREVDFHLPLVFASISDVKEGRQRQLAEFYNGTLSPQVGWELPADRHADFLGARLAYTPLGSSTNPLLATGRLLFKAHDQGKPPSLLRASVRIPALAALLGKEDPIQIVYDDTGPDSYVVSGRYAPANAIGVFARLVDDQGNPRRLALGFRADQAGGFATPNQSITALSRDQGPVAGEISQAMGDDFNPAKVFPPSPTPGLAFPLLFGTFGLDKLLKKGAISSQAPQITTRREAAQVITQLRWNPSLEPEVPVGVATLKLIGAGNLRILGETRTPLDGGAPSSRFSGILDAFDIDLLSSVTIHFTAISFTSENGAKPDVKVALDDSKPLEFIGDLSFVEDLRNAIPPGLFGDGASLEVLPTGIRAGFAVALPPLDIGVFALKDVGLGAALTLPFLDGKPILDFNVSERANPFQLRVAFFAGGGFFHLQMDTAGMRQLEVSLEFGAAFGLSIAVATGEVHAMAGIYFGITRNAEDTESNCTLSGFLRLGGRLAVIGLIRLSVEFNLSFTYQEASEKAFGRATVTVMVEVLFISVSVELTVERAFGGAGDPVFQQTFPAPPVWHEYASAFA